METFWSFEGHWFIPVAAGSRKGDRVCQFLRSSMRPCIVASSHEVFSKCPQYSLLLSYYSHDVTDSGNSSRARARRPRRM